MFRFIAGSIPGGADALFRLHPVQLAAQLELAWELRVHVPALDIGHPDHRSDLPSLPSTILGQLISAANAPNFAGQVRWRHLIYAYMIENTKVCEIFREVVRQFVYGEQLGTPIPGTEHWLRNTEELFYRSPPPFFINAFTSTLRPELDATRRCAYYRLFGLELNHQAEDRMAYEKAMTANTQFVSVFEEFLREVWTAIVNVTTTSGPNPKDDAEIANLAEQLHNMLTTRRLGGNLAREEFFFVCMMEWFHLTLQFNSSIVLSLRADATSPEQRLLKLGERVGVPAHALSKNYFDLADAISNILIEIETGLLNNAAAAPALYTPGTLLETDMRTIMTHYSMVTGREMKAKRVTPTPALENM